MKNVLIYFVLMIASCLAYAGDVVEKKNFDDMPSLQSFNNLVGKKDTLAIFVPEGTELYNYFNNQGPFATKDPEYYQRAVDLRMGTLPDMKLVKSVMPVEGGSTVVLDISNSQKDLIVSNKEETYFIQYSYAYGYLTGVDLHIVIDGSGQEVDKQADYLKLRLQEYFVGQKYMQSPDISKVFTSFKPWSGYDSDEYRSKDSIAVVKFVYFKGYEASIRISFQSNKFNGELPAVLAKNEQMKQMQYAQIYPAFK